MYAYTGPEDLTRLANNELGALEVRHRISILTSLDPKKVPMEVVIEPFHAGNLPGNVSRS